MKTSTILICLLLFAAALTGNPPNSGGQQNGLTNSTASLKPLITSWSTQSNALQSLSGYATWYSVASCQAERWGKRQPITASGTPFSDSAMICALPLDLARAWNMKFGQNVRVTNVTSGRSVTVKYLDRGPGRTARANGVCIDLSPAAFRVIGELRQGRIRVKVEAL